MILCVSPRCRPLGRHRPDCVEECRGCLPRMAADWLASRDAWPRITGRPTQYLAEELGANR